MGKMWEVDPETRSKLMAISKTKDNHKCVDCGAPSPQWASPKFGIFFCLACSGIHRSLGVHISFVRSVSMDAFKTVEVRRMELGGNKPWKDFFDCHASNTLIGREFDNCTIAERYDSDAGEEWKERLSAKVEGTEYVPGASKPATPKQTPAISSTSVPSTGGNPPLSSSRSPPPHAALSQKTQNEAYFARVGQENATRPEGVPPSQGGKYAGFGSTPMPMNNSAGGAPSADDFQKDPVAALTKGLGWLSSTVSKQAATVNKIYIQPGMKNIQEGDFAAQAKAAALNLGSTVQQGTKEIGDQFNKFVDPEYQQGGAVRSRAEPEKKDFWDSFGQDPAGPPREKKEFWDDFVAAGQTTTSSSSRSKQRVSTLGTSAMKSSSGSTTGTAVKKDDDSWGEW